jgi:thiamine biosynthesis lipoprotein
MRITKYTFTLLLFVAVLLPHTVNAGKKTSADPNKPIIFNKKAVLPGAINIDFSIVSLPEYKKEVQEVFDYSFSQIEKIAETFSGANPSNDLTRLEEAAGGKPIQVSPETLALARHAKEIADWTRGAFEPVRGPGNYKNLKINKKNSTLSLTKPGLSLDFGNILEGFMADLFIRAANAANIEHAFIKVNGVSRALGRATYGPWTIQISGHSDSYAKHGRQISLSNYSAATVGGNSDHPVVDPRSGNEVNSGLYSVTVITKEAATSQGVASSVYVMGPAEGKDLIDALGIKAILAFKDGKMKQIGRW